MFEGRDFFLIVLRSHQLPFKIYICLIHVCVCTRVCAAAAVAEGSVCLSTQSRAERAVTHGFGFPQQSVGVCVCVGHRGCDFILTFVRKCVCVYDPR